jgi:hypothetical protein
MMFNHCAQPFLHSHFILFFRACDLPVIEKYTSNTRFCMICNYVNKIIPALQSRCTK